MNSAQLEKSYKTPPNLPASQRLQTYLSDRVAPVAQQIDSDPALLFEAFEAMGELKLLTPKAPSSLGGNGLSTQQFWQFQSLMARYSGALAFLQTQHQSAASFLLTSENKALQQDYLPAMAVGKKRVGVGFSQLRRQPCPLQAQPIQEGYLLSGEVPWVSGAGLFDEFVGAAVLPSGEAVFGLLPLTSQKVAKGQLMVDEPMALAAVPSTSTVRVRLKNWVLAADCVVGLRPAGWIESRDRANPLSPLGLMFGCAQAGIASAVQSLSRRQIEHELIEQLETRLHQLQAELPKAFTRPEADYDCKIALRGQVIALMNTCAQTAIIAASGAANAATHPAQRIYRESLVFSVSGQTKQSAIASFNALMPTIKRPTIPTGSQTNSNRD